VTDTSKLGSQGPVHGGRGTFLAHVSAISLLSITSHHHLHQSHNSMSMYKSEVISRQIPAPAQHHLPYFDHGTRVAVRDLFGNMPVRVKQRAITAERQGANSKDWEGLKRDVVMLLLAWPRKVAVTVRELGTGQKMIIRSLSNGSLRHVDVSNVCSILTQASFITPGERSSWVSIGASTSKLEITGSICLDPSATKNVQFISFGIHPLTIDGQSIIHDEINRLFLDSAFGNEEEGAVLDDMERERRAGDARYKGDGYTIKELRGGRKGVDRWPMFYINVHQISTSEGLDMDGTLDNKGGSLNSILELLKAMIFEFLMSHHFRPKAAGGPRLQRISKDFKNASGTIDRSLPSRDRQARSNGTHGSRARLPNSYKTGKSPRGSITNSDLLGANVKLPSFRRTESTSESPFEAWSRIKSGTGVSKSGSHKDLVESPPSQVPRLERPSTAPLPSTTQTLPPSTRTSTPDPTHVNSKRYATPLVSSTGQLTRRPFEDAPVPEVQSETPRPLAPLNDGEAEQLGGDDLIPWMNPITKVTSLVNKRTGPTIHTRKTGNSHQARSQSISNLRLSSRKKMKSKVSSPSEASHWIASVLRSWVNPVFSPTEAAIPQLAINGPDAESQTILQGHRHDCSQFDIDKAFKESSVGIGGRISKDALRNSDVISQVDKKFILVKLRSSKVKEEERGQDGTTLVIIDQHAADERIRIEGLMDELCMPPQSIFPAESGILSIPLEEPLSFDVSPKEFHLLRAQKRHFADWGILYDIPTKSINIDSSGKETQRLAVSSLPPGIVEKCKADPRILIELIRAEAWKIDEQGVGSPAATTVNSGGQQPWPVKIKNCPQGIIDMLNSRACRSAIMFNDELSSDQCKTLITRLADCAFPFQCAHGRPSLVPLVDLAGMENSTGDDFEASGSFGKGFRRWKRSLDT
jgi:DNA mismatch repair protein MLH3